MRVLEFQFINKDVMSVTFVLNDNIFHCYVFLVTSMLSFVINHDKQK